MLQSNPIKNNKFKKSFWVICSILFFSNSFLFAQTIFQKTIGMSGNTEGYSIKPTFDGDYIISGTTSIPNTVNSNVCLIKMDTNGDTLWTKLFIGINPIYNNSVEQTSDSGFIVAGTMGYTTGNYDGYLIKTDSTGGLIWSKKFGESNYDIVTAVHQTTDGGYIVSGQFYISGVTAHLIKFNSSGNIVWVKEVIGSGGANDVKQTVDGGYIITGSDYYDAFLTKTDALGNILWSKGYGGTYIDRGVAIEQTNDGGYIITGNIYNSDSSYHYSHLIKTDSNGDTLWVKTFGGTGNDQGNCVKQTSDGGYIFTGFSNVYQSNINFGDVSLLKTDSIGNIQWSKAFSGTSVDKGYFLTNTFDGGYLIAGSNHDFPGSGNENAWFIKTDSVGSSLCNDTSWIPSVVSYSMQVFNQNFSINSPTLISTVIPISVSSGGIVNTLCSNVGLNQSTNTFLFQIYPNPSFGNFIISFDKLISRGRLEIVNLFGEIILEENIINEFKKDIALNNLSKGIYFVKVFDGDNSFCKKIIIQN
jgi:hypothetical protein